MLRIRWGRDLSAVRPCVLVRASGTEQLGLPNSPGFVLRMVARDLLQAGQLWCFESFRTVGVLKQLRAVSGRNVSAGGIHGTNSKLEGY